MAHSEVWMAGARERAGGCARTFARGAPRFESKCSCVMYLHGLEEKEDQPVSYPNWGSKRVCVCGRVCGVGLGRLGVVVEPGAWCGGWEKTEARPDPRNW